MNILVTGGAGYIGSHVVHELVSLGHKVTVIDNLSTGVVSAIPRGVRFIEGDVGDATILNEALHGTEAILHFAASTRVDESVSDPGLYYKNNTLNTFQLIQSAIKHNVKYFVYSSTAAVYGNEGDGVVSETSTIAPISPYGHSKWMSEQILSDLASKSELKFVILRYFNVAGASTKYPIGQSTPEATHLVKVCAEAAAGKRKKLDVYGLDYSTPDGTCIRDYIHVEDLADAHILALNYLEKKNPSEVFNCGYQKGYSIKEVINSMKTVSGCDFEVRYVGRREGDIEKIMANSEKIKKVLGFKPKYDNIDLICKSAYEWELQCNS